MLEGPVHVDTASLAILYIIFVHSSALWTFSHFFAPLSLKTVNTLS
jgi:hypothetical protein